MSVARAAAMQLAWPVSWYATWVRAHPDNAKQLERLAQTVAMVVSDPGNLINMEGYWSLSKLYAYLNETLMHTAGRRVPAAEVTAYVLHVVQEVECLVELALRKYRGHRAAWNALLGLAAVKCVLNLCVHRQFFLVRWVCTALTLSLRRWRLRLMHGSQRLLQLRWLQRRRDGDAVSGGVGSGSARMRAGQNGKMTTRRATTTAVADTLHMRKLPAPGGAPLVVPRVMSSRTRVTQLHEHEQQHLLQRQQHVYRQLRSDDDNANDVDDNDNDKAAWVVVATNGELVRVAADEAQLARDEAASVPFTWIDALGMTVDAYLLLRPVLLIGSARHLFLRRSSRRWRDDAHDGRVDEVAQPRLALTATAATADGGEERMQMAHAAVTAAPHASLFASWKLWCAFTLLDLVVVLLSRFIRKRRVPIVYVGATHDESSNGSVTAVAPASHDALAAAEQQHNNNDEDDKDTVSAAKGASGAGNGHAIDVRNGGNHHHHDHNNGEHAVVPTHHDATATATNGVVPAAAAAAALVTPAVVSRDSLRVQHALRNLVVGFLRDPFFSAVLKRYLYTHFVQGTINKVPLLGPLLGFQVGYFLAMQHYSFLYSAGQ